MLMLLPPYDGRVQAGFHHLSDRLASLLDPGRDLGLWPNMPGGSQQRISVTSPGASGSDGLGARYDGMWPQEPMRTL
jgi:hypothetical protein